MTDGYRYKLERSTSSSGPWTDAGTETSGTSGTATGLDCGTTYYFRVSTRGDGSPYSATFGDTSSAVSRATSDCVPAPAPTGLSVTGFTATSVSLSWNPVTDGYRYKLERSTSSSGPWTDAGSETGGTSGTATGLDCDTTYYFRVSARGDGSPYSTTFGDTSSAVSRATSECSTAPAPTGLSVTSATDASVSLSWNPVAGVYQYKLERSTNSSGPWTDARSETGDTSGTATGLECSTTYYFRVSARGDGSPYSTTFGSASSSVSRATSACAPTIGVDVQSPFVGQAVTMTVSTTGSSGTVSSYQWQEWSAGSWTDLGATTTSATRSESTSVAGYRTFRVVVAYTSGTPVESYAVTIEWKGMTVTVTSTPEFPQSGPAATSTVTLTAGGDVPSGAVYQWQQATSSGWTDLGATSTSATKDVWSATRGTLKYRVVASHVVVGSAESAPVYVTWDEWDIVAEMIGELSAAVATSTDYTNAQTSLLSCMSATSTTSTGSGPKSPSDSRAPTMPPAVTFATFDDLLASYTGDVKARMDAGGDCAATSSAMFSRNESTTRAVLVSLKAGNAVYAALLDTPHGQQFEANVGDAAKVRLHAYLLASQLQNEAAQQGASGQSRPTPPIGQPTGLDCVPIDPVPSIYSSGSLTLQLKLAVLNCLVFESPFSFWTNETQTDELLRRIRSTRLERAPYDWLGWESWECSPELLPDLVVPNDDACLRHDLAYGSLTEFIGSSTTTAYAENDLAWNPRNRFLADELFAIDLACASATRDAENTCVRVGRGEFTWRELELRISWIGSRTVSGTFRFLSDKFFGVKVPVTDLDIAHARETPRFVQCNMPSIEVTDVRVENRWTFVGEWMFSATSCTGETYSVDSITWQALHENLHLANLEPLVETAATNTSSRFVPRRFLLYEQRPTSVNIVQAALRPDNDVNFGGPILGLAVGHTYTSPGGSPD